MISLALLSRIAKFFSVHNMPSLALTESIRKNLDYGNLGCGIFVDLDLHRMHLILLNMMM